MSGPFSSGFGAEGELSAPPPGRKPLTVLQMVDAVRLGPAEQAARELASAVIAAGGRSAIVAGPDLAHRVRVAGAETIGWTAERSLFSRQGNVGELATRVAPAQIDVVHARSTSMIAAGSEIARRIGAAFVATLHEAPSSGVFGAKLTGLASAQRVIAVSDFVAGCVPPKSAPHGVEVIHRGADMTVFAEEVVGAERTIKLAEDWGLAEDTRPLILTPGPLDAGEGHEALFGALARIVQSRGTEAFLCLVVSDGAPERMTALEEAAVKAGLSGSVKLVGGVDDMPAALKLAAVVASGATAPPASARTLIQAQAMGRPVIAPAHGAAAEVVEHGVSGWLTPPGDSAALAAALEAALDMDESQRAHLGLAGRARVRARFTLEAMLGRTLSIYEELAGRPFSETDAA